MKQFISSVILFAFLFNCSNTKTKVEEKAKESGSQIVAPKEDGGRIIADQTSSDTLKGSLKAKATGTIGTTGITINYYSPAVRGRVIWGGLVPFDMVWVTGAHRATNIEFNQDVTIGGTNILPGKYALFTIPGKTEWTFIINKNWEQHLADNYNQKEDIVRVKVMSVTINQNQERLMYMVESDSANSGTITVRWEKVKISLTVLSHR